MQATMRLLLFLSLLAASLTGCGSWRLRPDPGPGAVRSQYPQGEVVACGQKWNGLAVCALNEGEPYDKVKISVQGYYRGTMRVYSRNCEIDDPVAYEKNGSVDVYLPGVAKKNCLITVTVAPEYPKREEENLAVYPFRVHVAVKVKKGEAWSGYVHKATADWQRTLRIPVGGDEEVRVLAEGCGVSYDRKLTAKDGTLEFPLHEAVSKAALGTCVLDAVVVSPQYQDYLFTVVASNYDPAFTPLPIPVLFYDDGKIHVLGDNTVSVVALDGSYKLENQASWKWDGSKPHVLRLLTVKGRLALGVWEPEKKAWNWIP